MESSASNRESRTLGTTLSRDLLLATIDLKRVANVVERAFENAAYKNLHRRDGADAIEIRGTFGSKHLAFLIGLLPFGRHTRWGKRLHARARIEKADHRTSVKLQVKPFMALFDESEAILVSQSVAEKASDEYLGALHLEAIARSLYEATNTPYHPPTDGVQRKGFAADFVLRFLFFFLEGDDEHKVLHVPPKMGRTWSWSAFLVPAIWFVWHELWGVAVIVLVLQFVLISLMMILSGQLILFMGTALFFILRAAAGLNANSIFYARYGRWPTDGG